MSREGGRIAIREQGDLIAAYWARESTMDGAQLIATIQRRVAEEFPDIYEAWQEMLREIMTRIYKQLGQDPGTWTTHAAPEHERAGNS